MKQKSKTTTGKSALTGEKVTFRNTPDAHDPSMKVSMPERPPTMREREGAAEAAMWRDIDKARSEYHVLMVPKNTVPPDARLAECYETAREWVVVGEPWRGEDESDSRYHNCETMGCGTLFHVVARIQKERGEGWQ